MNNKEITKQSYQATAHTFARNVADLAPIASMERFLSLLPPHAKIVDLGCGSGRDAKIFSSKDCDVLGIDFCSNLIDIAKAHAPLAHFKLMDIEALDLPHSSFDGVWSACSLGHIPKNSFPAVLKNIHSILKENGYFYLALKQGSGEILEVDSRYEGHIEKFWSYFEENELKDFLHAANFKIIEFDLVEKKFAYQSHPAFRIFCQKIS
jgi:SAM-dependent methyltransferase